VRVVEYASDGTARPVLTQFEPAEGNTGRVVFLVPGTTAAKSARSFAVHFDTAAGAAKPPQPTSNLTVRAEGGSYWVENDCYRILVGRQGAHLYEWYVKALDGLEITEPGRGGWAGFADSGFEDRDADFDLKVTAAGPVQVRLTGVSTTGSNEKVFIFTAGKPYVEVMLARPVGFYWDYDSVVNFAADKGHPGTALFSNGQQAPICRSNETTHNAAQGVYWGAKVRDDGLVLANLTPTYRPYT